MSYLFTWDQVAHAFGGSPSDLLVVFKHIVLNLWQGFLLHNFHSVKMAKMNPWSLYYRVQYGSDLNCVTSVFHWNRLSLWGLLELHSSPFHLCLCSEDWPRAAPPHTPVIGERRRRRHWRRVKQIQRNRLYSTGGKRVDIFLWRWSNLKETSCAVVTLSPGKAISGLETEAILARAWQAFTFPGFVPSKARGISAWGKIDHLFGFFLGSLMNFCESSSAPAMSIF